MSMVSLKGRPTGKDWLSLNALVCIVSLDVNYIVSLEDVINFILISDYINY